MGLLLKWAGRASSIQICLSPAWGCWNITTPAFPDSPASPCLSLGLAGFPVWSQGGRQRKGWLRTFSGCPGTCPPSTGAQAREDPKPRCQTRLSLPHHLPHANLHPSLSVLPTQLGPGAVSFPAPCTPALVQLPVGPYWVCRAFGEAHVGVPALAWGRTGPSHCAFGDLSLGFDLSPTRELTYCLSDYSVGEGRAARTGVCVGYGLRRWVRASKTPR